MPVVGISKKREWLLNKALNMSKSTHSKTTFLLVAPSFIWAMSIENLANSLEQAREILEEAFAIHQIHHPQDHSQYAWSLLHLGFVNRELGQPQAAKLILI